MFLWSKTELYLKITNEKENHNGFQYHTGLNILAEPFSIDGSCVPGGLYFTNIKNIHKFLDYGIYLREIELPHRDKNLIVVKVANDKWRANKIILGKRYNLCDVSTFKYLIDKGLNINALKQYIFQWACQTGLLDIAQWLYNLRIDIGINIDIYINNNQAFREACENGHLCIAQWLYSIDNNNNININADNEYAFRYSCENGHLAIAKWLYSIDRDINIHADKQYAFRWACINGHLDVLQWLYSFKSIKKYAKSQSINRFAWTCRNGYFDVAQWLYSIGKIDIHHNNEQAFTWSCMNGHLEIAQWLYKLGMIRSHSTDSSSSSWTDKQQYRIDIHANDDIAFKSATNNGHDNVVQWLNSVDGGCIQN